MLKKIMERLSIRRKNNGRHSGVRGKRLDEDILADFREHLIMDEKSAATIGKYLRDVRAFITFLGERPVEKEVVMEWRESLLEAGYVVSSVNSMLVGLKSLLRFLGWEDCIVKSLKTQRRCFAPEDMELTMEEYQCLLKAAGGNSRIGMVVETIARTGVRVSELSYIMVEAVKKREVVIRNKGKIRVIMLPDDLAGRLLEYAEQNDIREGSVFITRNGKPLDRSYVWKQTKELCREAGVSEKKGFPHNLRKLFARIFYEMCQDLAKVADVLGHSSLDTTRLYVMTSGSEHRITLEMVGLALQGKLPWKKQKKPTYYPICGGVTG